MSFRPYIMRNVDLIISAVGAATGGDNFHCQARSVTLTPDTAVERIKTLCPDGQFADVGNPEWSLEIGYLNGDVESGDTPSVALADYLLTNMGQKRDIVFRPQAGGRGYQVTVTLVPGSIGGEEGSWSEGSVELPVDGQPVPVAAEAAAAPVSGGGSGGGGSASRRQAAMV